MHKEIQKAINYILDEHDKVLADLIKSTWNKPRRPSSEVLKEIYESQKIRVE